MIETIRKQGLDPGRCGRDRKAARALSRLFSACRGRGLFLRYAHGKDRHIMSVTTEAKRSSKPQKIAVSCPTVRAQFRSMIDREVRALVNHRLQGKGGAS